MAGGTKIGITGLPGSGRTELLLTIVEMLQAEKVKVGGLITEPIFEEDKVIGFKMIRERFTSRVRLDEAGRRIDVSYVEGPFKYLDNHWVFEDHPVLEIYEVTFNSWGGKRIYAMLFVPKGAKKPLPAIVGSHPGTTGSGGSST